jgi:hypothetical protein
MYGRCTLPENFRRAQHLCFLADFLFWMPVKASRVSRAGGAEMPPNGRIFTSQKAGGRRFSLLEMTLRKTIALPRRFCKIPYFLLSLSLGPIYVICQIGKQAHRFCNKKLEFSQK